MNSRIVFLLCLIVTVGRFALDSYLPSLPAIAHAFHTQASQVQLTLTLYLIGFGVSQLIYGPLSERYGRRKVILCGFSLFIIGSILCSLTQSITALIIFRLMAGIGGGVGPALKRAIAADNFDGPMLVKVWSKMSTAVVITLVIAPVIGGYIQVWFGWRANFLIAAMYAALISLAIYKLLPETSKNMGTHSLSIPAMSQNYWALLRHKSFIGYVISSMLAFAGLIIYFQVSPFLFINELNLSPSTYGWLSLCIAATYLVAGFIVNKLIHKIGLIHTLKLGTFILTAGGLLMLIPAFLHYMNVWVILLPSMVYVLGARIIIPNAAAGYLKSIPHLAGYASALMGFIQMAGSSLTSFIVSQFYQRNQLQLAITFVVLGILAISVFYNLVLKNHIASKTQTANNIADTKEMT